MLFYQWSIKPNCYRFVVSELITDYQLSKLETVLNNINNAKKKNESDYNAFLLVLLPPVVTIIIAILTKRAALFLLIGIVLSSIIFTQTINASTLYSIGYHFLSVFFLMGI